MNGSAEPIPAPSDDSNSDRVTIIGARIFLILHSIFLLWATAQVISAIIGFSINTYILATFLLYFCLSSAQISFGKIALEEEDEIAGRISSYLTIGLFTIDLFLLIISIALMIMEDEFPIADPRFPLVTQSVILIVLSMISHLCSFLLSYFSLHEYLEKIKEC